MNKLVSYTSWTFAFVLGSVIASSHADALYCGNHLVERGDAMARVMQYCGEPSTRVTRTEVRTGAGVVAGVTYGVPIATTVQIDVWTYDFGPMRFMEEITFENGVVYASRPMGYGTASGHGRSGWHAPPAVPPLRFVPPRRADALWSR